MTSEPTLFDSDWRVTLRDRIAELLYQHPDGLSDWQLTFMLGLPERMKGSVVKRRGEITTIPNGRRVGPMLTKERVWQHPLHAGRKAS